MFQGLLWPLTPSPAPEMGLQGLQGRAAGPSLVVAPHVGSGPAPGCPWAALTQALGGCWLSSLPAEPWEPGEQADPWDREPAAFPAPPTHSPGPPSRRALGAAARPALPSGSLAGGGGHRDCPGPPRASHWSLPRPLASQGWGLHGPRGGAPRPVHSPRPAGLCGVPFLPNGGRRHRRPLGASESPWVDGPEPPGQGHSLARGQAHAGSGQASAAPPSAWEPGPQGSRVPGLPLWEAGGGGTGFSGRGVGWGGGRALRAYRGDSGHQPWELWHRWFPRVWPGPCGWHHVCLLP